MKRNLDSFLFAAMILLCPAALAIKATPGNDSPRARTHSATSRHQPRQVLPDLAEFDRQVARIAGKLREMRKQMEAVQHARDSQERLRILDEHWKALQASMENLQELWGPGMMGCCGSMPAAEDNMGNRMTNEPIHGPENEPVNGSTKGSANGPANGSVNGPMMGGTMNWRSAGGYYTSLTLEQIRQRQYLTDQYLALQQQIMRQWMLHQHWLYQIQTQSPARAR